MEINITRSKAFPCVQGLRRTLQDLQDLVVSVGDVCGEGLKNIEFVESAGFGCHRYVIVCFATNLFFVE